MGALERVETLLLIAAIVAMLARRARVPYTIGLVAAGGLMALLKVNVGFTLTRELIFDAFLPPLLFEAAFFIDTSALKRDLRPILTLASAGVVISAAITAFGMHQFAGWEWRPSVVFGALIAATDPVSVIATFKDAKVHGRLRLLVESESLFNDGVAAVLFGVALVWASGGEFGAATVAVTLWREVGGGVAIGLAVGALTLWLAGRTDDHLIEISFTSIAAYASFLIAQRLHCSGVLSTLVCGLLLGNIGSLGALTDKGRETVGSFWEYAAFVANSLIFLLIGARTADARLETVLAPIGIAIIVTLIARAGSVYGLATLFARGPRRIERGQQHILFWGGLRGALALALALSLPADLPRRSEITAVAFGVVIFSIVVQGLTITPLLRRLGVTGDDPGVETATPSDGSNSSSSG